MPHISRTFTVTAPRDVAVDYLRDFSNTEEWEPGTRSCRRLGDRPIAVGTRWHNESVLAGIRTELVYELTHLGPDLLRFIGWNSTATSTDTMTFRDVPGGTEITYTAEITFKGVAKLADLPARLLFRRVASDIVRNLTRILA